MNCLHLQLGTRSLEWVATRPTVCNPDPLCRIIAGDQTDPETVPPALSLVRAIAVIPGGVSPQHAPTVPIVFLAKFKSTIVGDDAAPRNAASLRTRIAELSLEVDTGCYVMLVRCVVSGRCSITGTRVQHTARAVRACRARCDG